MGDFLLAVGMLVHLGIYLARQGTALFRQFSPALAVHVPRPVYTVVAGGFMAAMISWAYIGASFRPIALLALIVWASMQSLRLSNHVAFLALLLMGFLILGQAVQAEFAASMLGWMYVSAGLYKVNRDFLFTSRSVPRVLAADQYRRLTGRSLPKIAMKVVPSATVALELCLGVSLLVGITIRPIMICALIAHFIFLIIGHAHYSLVALGAWCIAANASFGQALDLDMRVVQLVVALGVLAGAGLATPWVFRWSLLGRCVTGTAAGVYALVAFRLATLPNLLVALPGMAAVLVGLVAIAPLLRARKDLTEEDADYLGDLIQAAARRFRAESDARSG